MIRFLKNAWRNDLATVVKSARGSLLVAAPFIKYNEAVWLLEQARSGVEITTLSNINAESVGAAALDLKALLHLSGSSPRSKLISLPSLHAKVFIADEKCAVVTSGNLTRSGLDRNLEYGVQIQAPALVKTVRMDMLEFAQLGYSVDAGAIANLIPLETELRAAHTKLKNTAGSTAKRAMDETMRRVLPNFVAVQIGGRSAHAVFGEAIQFVLKRGAQTTHEIQEEVRRLLPDICDDREYFAIKGVRYGKAWKRRFRHAQLHLKRKGVVRYSASSKTWKLARS